jgi:hypothetical protein
MAKEKKPHVYPVPSNYEQLKTVRASKSVELKKNSYVKDTTKLRPYQSVGALNMLLLKYFILGDDPGLGKTLQTLVAFAIAKSFNPNLQMIVFTMKSAKRQWAKEVTKFLQGISCHVLSNSFKSKVHKKTLTGKAARDAQYAEMSGVDIFVCGYYPLMIEPRGLRSSRGSDMMVIFDELIVPRWCTALQLHQSRTGFWNSITSSVSSCRSSCPW